METSKFGKANDQLQLITRSAINIW